jgi:hypothetical protein
LSWAQLAAQRQKSLKLDPNQKGESHMNLSNVLVVLVIILASIVAAPSTGHAEDAKSCIEIGPAVPHSGRTSMQMRNLCSKKIIMSWCHSASSFPGTKRSLCGANLKKYFTHSTTLKRGEIKKNLYTLPGDAEVEFGACIGGYGKIFGYDGKGGYRCK